MLNTFVEGGDDVASSTVCSGVARLVVKKKNASYTFVDKISGAIRIYKKKNLYNVPKSNIIFMAARIYFGYGSKNVANRWF